jgi:ferredoxin
MSGDKLFVMDVDIDKCVGVGQCELLEPEVFYLDDDTGLSTVVGAGSLPPERARAVAEKCPSAAIKATP